MKFICLLQTLDISPKGDENIPISMPVKKEEIISTTSSNIELEKSKSTSFSALNPINRVTKKDFDMSKLSNLSALSESDLKDFFDYKEEQYANRRDLVQKYCNVIGSVFLSETSRTMKVRNDSLIYNSKDKVAYCQIAKVSHIFTHDFFSVFNTAFTNTNTL